MNNYDLIVARETVTLEALKKHGIFNNVMYMPDNAFLLKVSREKSDQYKNEKNNFVGINLSPLVDKLGTEGNMVYHNYVNLINYILQNTGCSILLIPHVIRAGNDDREIMQKLLFDCPSERITLMEDCNCEELKGIIASCRFFIGARTHATIAAYSSCVPTIVVGYSVKSIGIAKDLFGTSDNYVIPVQGMKSDQELVISFQWLLSREEEIISRLKEEIPVYRSKIQEFSAIIERINK